MYLIQDNEAQESDCMQWAPNVRQVRIELVEAGVCERDGKRPLPLRATFRAIFVSDHERGQIAWNGGTSRADLRECKAYCAARGIAIVPKERR